MDETAREFLTKGEKEKKQKYREDTRERKHTPTHTHRANNPQASI